MFNIMLKKFHRWLMKIILLNLVINFSVPYGQKPKVTIKNHDNLKINPQINNTFYTNTSSSTLFDQQDPFTDDVSLIALYDIFANILFKAFIEAMSWLKNQKSFFFDKNTPAAIKNGISKELAKFDIVIDELNVPYGLLSKKALNEKTDFIRFSFGDLVNYFKLIISGSSEYLNLFEDIDLLDFYQGKCKSNIYMKSEILFKNVATQYIINDIHYQILSILGAKDGITPSEQEIFNNKSNVIKHNIKYNYILNKLLEFLIKKNVNIINEAKRNINLWTVLKLEKNNRNKTMIQNLINKIVLSSNDNVDEATNYNYDLYFLQAELKETNSKMIDINCDELSDEVIYEFNEFLNNQSLKNNVNFFVVDNGSNFLIIPRFNPLNEYKMGTIADRFTTQESAIDYSANLVAHHMIDDEMMAKLPNNKTKIVMNIKEKGKNNSYSINLLDFFKQLNIYSYDEKKVNIKNSPDEFFYQLNKHLISIALIEAVNIYRERKSLINKSQLNLSDFAEANIIIEPFMVQSMTKNDTIETKPIIINFNEIVYTILEYLESNIITFVDGVDSLLNNINDVNQKKLIELITEVITKNLIISAIKKTYIMALYDLDINEKIHKKEIEILQKIAIRSNLASEYIKRLLQEKRIGIQGAVEERRQSIYALQILCANKETKDGNISVIKDVINEIAIESNIEILRNELINRQINFQSSADAHHLYFNQIPKKIQDEYLEFINDNKSGNFYIGTFENFKELKSGNEFILYILPKYDIRNANKKPGVFEKDVLETEIGVLINNELYPYLQEIFKLNKEKTVIFIGSVNKNDGKNPTEEHLTKIATTFKNFLAVCDLHATDPASLYVNLRASYSKQIFKTANEIQEEKKQKEQQENKQYYLSKKNILDILKENNKNNKKKMIEEFSNTNENNSDQKDINLFNKQEIFEIINLKNENELKIFLKKKFQKNQQPQDKPGDKGAAVKKSEGKENQQPQDKPGDKGAAVKKSEGKENQQPQDKQPQDEQHIYLKMENIIQIVKEKDINKKYQLVNDSNESNLKLSDKNKVYKLNNNDINQLMEINDKEKFNNFKNNIQQKIIKDNQQPQDKPGDKGAAVKKSEGKENQKSQDKPGDKGAAVKKSEGKENQ